MTNPVTNPCDKNIHRCQLCESYSRYIAYTFHTHAKFVATMKENSIMSWIRNWFKTYGHFKIAFAWVPQFELHITLACTYQGAELSPPLFKLCKLDCFLCNAQWLSSDLKRVFVNSFYFQIALVFILHNWSRFLWLLLWTRWVAESEASEYDIFQKNALRMVIRRWFLHGFTLPKPPLGKNEL